MNSSISKVDSWLKMHDHQDGGILMLSPNRLYAYDELSYDNQYYENDVHLDLSAGKGLLNLLASRNIDRSLPIWEMGCGTGSLTLGVLYNHDYPNYIISDISTNFLKIVKNKMALVKKQPKNYLLAAYDSENYYYTPPEESFSVIALQNTLHHVINPEKFIEEAAKLLVGGGALVFDEPCREGNALLGLLCKFYYQNLKQHGIGDAMNNEYFNNAYIHFNAMVFYGRRDIDKSASEDKNFFILEQMMTSIRKSGFELEFIPNKYFCHFDEFDKSDEKSSFRSLREFGRYYLKICMGYSDEFVEDFCKFSDPYFNYYDELTAGTIPPTFHGIFICKKK